MQLKTWPLLLVILSLLLVANLMFGAVSISFEGILDGFQTDSEHYFTVYEYRFPRTLLAMMVGAMMALAGALVQGVIRNPLASPDVLGVSHGARLSRCDLHDLVPNIRHCLVARHGVIRRFFRGLYFVVVVRQSQQRYQTGHHRRCLRRILRQHS